MERRKLLTIVLTMVCSMFLYSSIFGQSPTKNIDIAEISNNGTSVSWLIKAPSDGGVIRVSTPSGEVYEEKFSAGSVPSFSPRNDRGEYYGDGQYTYEIILTPSLSPNVKAAMEQSRIDGTSEQVAAELRKSGQLPAEMVESGTFTFLRGNLVTDNKFVQESQDNFRPAVPQTEPQVNTKTPESKVPAGNVPQARRDVPTDDLTVIAMDLVVQGSQCLGIDCPNNPSFGFSTLILQENNLRIRFTDTSNSASFPTNDWEITINETTNGGQDKFSVTDITNNKIPFTIEGNSATNSLYVDSTSRIGFKTSTPVVELHVRDGDTPTLRLEQDGSSGFTAQTWDIAGNEANFFIRDVTNGSRLPFKIRPGAATDSLVIENNGNVTFGNSINIRGGGTSTVSSSIAQQFFGGQAVVTPGSTIPAVIDTNSFGVTTGGGNGGIIALLTIPSNANLASTTLPNVVYKIRYEDPDGTGASSFVNVDLIANDISTGARITQSIFGSNTNAATGMNTVTVCQAVGTGFFNYATHGTYLSLTLVGTAALNAKFFQVQIYRISGSC